MLAYRWGGDPLAYLRHLASLPSWESAPLHFRPQADPIGIVLGSYSDLTRICAVASRPAGWWRRLGLLWGSWGDWDHIGIRAALALGHRVGGADVAAQQRLGAQ